MTIIMKSNNEYVTIDNAVICLESFTESKNNKNLIFKNADDNTIWNVQLSEEIPQNPQYDIIMDCLIKHNGEESVGKINLESIYNIINEAAQICTFFALGGTLETLEQ
mgnify:CR=1 FL=1